jgi:tetratricopeptide (TPR) repeat protein
MTDSNKTVFISYRRDVSEFIARSIFLDLKYHDYDVFMDVESIDSGQFEKVILNQINARIHFIIILTKGTLNRCIQPEDWLRKEIEHALDGQRNIVPILVNDFKFDRRSQKLLTGKLGVLPKYNALELPHNFFDAAMERLRNRFLKLPQYDPVIVPTSNVENILIQQKIIEISQQPKPTEAALSAEDYFDAGYTQQQEKDLDGAIHQYYIAIALFPSYSQAYYNRGMCYYYKNDLNKAIEDYTRAIELRSDYIKAYNNRGVAFHDKGEFSKALADYSKAISLNPQFGLLYNNRGNAHRLIKDINRALSDYQKYLELSTDLSEEQHKQIGRIITDLKSNDAKNPDILTIAVNPTIVADALLSPPEENPNPEGHLRGLANIIATETGPIGKRKALPPKTVKFHLPQFQSEISFNLKKIGIIIVGRSHPESGSTADVDLSKFLGTELGVSKEHLFIRLDENRIIIEDNNSTNGTFLNDNRLKSEEPYFLQDGDRLTLGQMKLVVEILTDPSR